jgi:hypothetical protein
MYMTRHNVALRSAAALAEDLRMRPAVAHCHGDLAQVGRRAGRSEAAVRHLEAARELYGELDLPYWRERLSEDGSP